MTARIFLDTNVALYLKDAREPKKQQRAKEWVHALLDSQSLAVSPQVLNEIYAVGLRKFPRIPRQELRHFVHNFFPVCLAPLDTSIVAEAFVIEDGHHFNWWDCLILASAMAAGCQYLLSEDLQHGRAVGELTIINPFIVTPEEILTAT